MKYYLGIDLGGTNIAVGVADENYKLLSHETYPTKATHDFAEIVKDMADTAHKAVKSAGLEIINIESAGIGVPSSIDPKNNHVAYANNLDWYDVDLVAEFKKHIDLPVYIANDADCAALAESLAGAAKGIKNAVMLTLGTGIGGGVILNGKIFTGGTKEGLELGHIGIIMDGEVCTCGRQGCLETYASVMALIRDTIRSMKENSDSIMIKLCEGDFLKVSARLAFEAEKKGDTAAALVVRNYIKYLAQGIQTLTICYRPDVVIIGGGVCNEGENLLGRLREEVLMISYAPDLMILPQIVRATLSNEAGIIGAAFLFTGLL